MTEFVLCYVDEPWAWFTSAPLAEQSGDDWDAAPYELNSGPPNSWRAVDGQVLYRLCKIAYDGDFDTPCDAFPGVEGSPYSVDQINSGAVAWLRSNRYSSSPKVTIHAGTDLERFVELIHRGGGHIYMQIATTWEQLEEALESGPR